MGNCTYKYFGKLKIVVAGKDLLDCEILLHYKTHSTTTGKKPE